MTAAVRRAYGELDRAQVVASLHNLARRVGVQRVTMRELAAELDAAVPSVYYHVPGKQAALDLLAESVLAEIPISRGRSVGHPARRAVLCRTRSDPQRSRYRGRAADQRRR
jgi:AcrR family transcriptional regulator